MKFSLTAATSLSLLIANAIEDDTRKKEVEVLLVDADISKLQYEMTYHDEVSRGWILNLSMCLKHFRRVDFHEVQVLWILKNCMCIIITELCIGSTLM